MLRPGEAAADFDLFVAARQPALYRTALLLCGGDAAEAADAVQTSMVEIWRRWPRVRAMERADGYARKVLVTSVLRGRRQESRTVATGDVPDRLLDDHALAAVTRSDLWPVVQALPKMQRAVVVLRFYEDLSEVQAADVLGISVGSVKSHTSRALAHLRDRLPVDYTGGGRHE